MGFNSTIGGLWAGVIVITGVQLDELNPGVKRLVVLPFSSPKSAQIMVSSEAMTRLFFAGIEVPSNLRLSFGAAEGETDDILITGHYQESPGEGGLTLFDVEYAIHIPARYGLPAWGTADRSARDTVFNYHIKQQDLRGVRSSLALTLKELVEWLSTPEFPETLAAEPPRIDLEIAGEGIVEVAGPWCFIYLDGRLWSTSSGPKLRVEPGEHRIGLFSPSFGYEELRVVVKSGEGIILDFGREGWSVKR